MKSKLRWLLALGAVAALALTVQACGDDDDDEGGGGGAAAIPSEFAPTTAAPDDAQEGGKLTVIAAGDIDYMDPGAAYYQFTYMITDALHRKLVTYDPDDVEVPQPDGAEELPEISDGGKLITYTIREWMRFAPPVDREITAADYEYAIERALLPGVANGYQHYFESVVGFADAQAEAADNPTGGAPDIEGVTAVDDRTLEVELTKATALTVTGALGLPISAPVPEEYAEEFDAENPSTYGQNVVASGPYMVENNAQGELTGYTPGKEIKLVRNPNWSPETDFRPAYLEEIEVQEGFTDTASASRKILRGSHQVSGDIVPPPTVIREAAQEAEEGQMTITASGGNRYVGLNTQIPPTDDINVRKAIIANSDREALRNTRGGELIGPVATHMIPPAIPGFEEAGGLEGSGLDYYASPNGDPELAAEYMRKAGYESGKCEGPECEISMVGDNIAPGKDTAEVLKGQLEELGFKVDFRPVDHTIMYTRFCSIPDSQPEICPNVGWIKDYQDGVVMFKITFAGAAIDPENNSNWAQLDVPEIDKAIEECELIQDQDDRNQCWGDVDTQVMELAPVLMWVWDNQPNVASADVAAVINLFNANTDLSFTSLEG